MKGALVFLTVFAVVMIVTLGVPEMPPGQAMYDLLGVGEADSEVLGIGTTTLVVAVFNGIVYGIFAWLLYSFTYGRQNKAAI